MPDLSDVREIITACPGRVVATPSPTQRPDTQPLSPVQRYGPGYLHFPRGLSLRFVDHICKRFFSVLLRASPCFPALPAVSNGVRKCLAMSCDVLWLPTTVARGATPTLGQQSKGGTTGNLSNHPQRPSQGVVVGALSGCVDTLFTERLGDSKGRGLERCQRTTAPLPTCDRRSLPTSSTLLRARYVGGVLQGVDHPSFERAGLCVTAPTTSIPGLTRGADSTATEMPTRRHSPARETAASVENAERASTPRPARYPFHPATRGSGATPHTNAGLPTMGNHPRRKVFYVTPDQDATGGVR